MSDAKDLLSWHSPDSRLIGHLQKLCEQSLETYVVNPLLVEEHANLEADIASGGYGRRQIFELVQNGADAMSASTRGRIHVLLTESHLYCANEGAPIDDKGLNALLHAYLSVKRGDEIGRFGLGFKSVLGVTKTPQFFSRTVSFAFDAEYAECEIKKLVPDAERFPVLRVARLLDPLAQAAEDPILSHLMEWATSVVKLERNVGASDWLHNDVSKFPPEFLLFCDTVEMLALEDRVAGVKRQIRATHDRGTVQLVEGNNSSPWRVFRAVHTPSDAARADAGQISARDRLPVIWALPLGKAASVGTFWAFFPLSDQTTLSGVVNAPWKTNDDRTNLLDGPLNRELLAVAADLVVANLGQVQREDDPAWHLDAMPARGREARNWADEFLTQATYRRASMAPSLPNQKGVLKKPADLKLHPQDLPREALSAWADEPRRPEDWCHPSVDSRERRPRAERLLELAGRRPETLSLWLASLVEGTTPATYAGAIRVAATVARSNPALAEKVCACWILVDSANNPKQPCTGDVFLPSHGGYSEGVSVSLLHPLLAEDPNLADSLKILGVHPVTPILELRAFLGTGWYSWRDSQWDRFWDLVRKVDTEDATRIITENEQHRLRLKVRTLAGAYQHVNDTLLPGPIVPADGSRDAKVTLDQTFHAGELALLDRLGARAQPGAECGLADGDAFSEYRRSCVSQYIEGLEDGSPRPNQDLMQFSQHGFAGPLEPILTLGEEGCRLFSDAIMATETDLGDWDLRHKTQSRYPTRRFIHPVVWTVQTYGRLSTSLGGRRVRECLGPQLDHLKEVLPVAICNKEVAKRLGLPAEPSDLSSAHWKAGFEQAALVNDDAILGRFYGIAASFHEPPPRLWSRVGFDHRWEAPGAVTVVSTERELNALVTLRKPVLLAPTPEAADQLVRNWAMRPAEVAVRTELYYVRAGDPSPLADRFPGLPLVTNLEKLIGWELLCCSELADEILTEAGKTSEPTQLRVRDRTVYYHAALSDGELLDQVNSHLSLGLTRQDRDVVLDELVANQRAALVAQIRNLERASEKLLAAVGPDAVRRHVPAGLLAAVEARRGSLADVDVAELATVVYGIDVLKEFKNELEGGGFQPPATWAGSRRAITFVRQLGFGPEYAGSEEERREGLIKVEGPSTLPNLHDFQSGIKDACLGLVLHPSGQGRALMSLPTGAGKTRIAVQALVEAYQSGLSGLVLWIAQSDELCEQAVQTWAEVWHALGPQRQLFLCRLWSSNEAEPVPDEPQVIVATIQKLQGCIDDSAYSWLSKASCVVVDEAHHATTPEYTRALVWQGITPGKTGRCPLIGLTATPFRGYSEKETYRLVQRFGGIRLDSGLGEDPYAFLQNKRVLARVAHQLLGGAVLSLTPMEIDEIDRLKRLPASVSAQIAANADRNLQLIEDIASRPRDWPIIVFATSVEHAQSLAALLSLQGIVARPISAGTEPGTRRHYVEGFRSGSIQVLTNFGVLTQGFDAPSVRAIYVARPTFSPGTYQQMIGRGLRGPLNGGKEECLIVNVADNFEQFGTKLAFLDFEFLWRQPL
jgi:superfamily II DNA or RNA helicase